MRVLLAAIIGLTLGAILIAATGYSPADAYRVLFVEAFGSVEGIAGVVGKAIPLLLLGLGFTISFRAGLFNIGGEGQFVLGGLAAAATGYLLRALPAFVLIPLLMTVGCLAGALWAALAGWMKAKRNVHEVVSTIMLNHIAFFLGVYLINVDYGPLRNPASAAAQSLPIGRGGILPTLVPRTELHAGVFVALLLVPVAAWFLRRSVWGYEIRAVGLNPLASRTYGIAEGRVLVRAMAISGALAGLAGAMELMGVYNYVYTEGFSAGRGFDSITIALMGGGVPSGILAASLFLGALRIGASGMETVTGVPATLSFIIQGILIVAVSAPALAEFASLRRRKVGPPPPARTLESDGAPL